MRLVTFLGKDSTDRQRVGVVVAERILDIAGALSSEGQAGVVDVASMRSLLSGGESSLSVIRELMRRFSAAPGKYADLTYDFDVITFLPPVPDADKFLCVGKNYRSHLEELRRTDLIKEMPQEPTGFVKLNSCLTGHRQDVVRPQSVSRLDYEPELVFVMGRPAFGVNEANAMDYVAGITLLNDLTCRDTQKREVASGSRFWTAKNAPGFGPLGPFIITMDEVPDPYDIWVTCSVNGEQRMRVNTKDQIWKLPAILAHFSRLVPLQAGDMFSTGAPGGVAVGKPNAEALYLQPGDIVECGFERPAMTLSNRIVAPV